MAKGTKVEKLNQLAEKFVQARMNLFSIDPELTLPSSLSYTPSVTDRDVATMGETFLAIATISHFDMKRVDALIGMHTPDVLKRMDARGYRTQEDIKDLRKQLRELKV